MKCAGRELPRGDNNRVSLHYEMAKYADIDVVPGSEVPPMQATALYFIQFT